MFKTGEKFGRYNIRALLGAGGMGQVYLAEDVELERLVALKILLAEMHEDENDTARFVREAKAASALNHPNILTIYEIGETKGWRYMALEFVKGKTLSAHLGEEKMSLPQTLDIASQIISALAAAHAGGIVHRDIKPENLMIREDNLVKILDFGIAKLIENQNNQITKTGAVIGTPQYMSPEQAEGKAVDARTDLWSFGAVFYEMLTGKKAFTGETLAEIMVSLMMKEPISVRELNGEIPAEIEAIVHKLLRKNPDERFQTAEELAEIFRNLKKHPESGKPDFSVLQIAPNIPNNLPENLFPLVGREKEIGEICRILRDETQLLTLTGIGGTGKTRLSQAVARELLKDFSDGVFFVELDAIKNPDLFAATVAQTLGVRESGSKTILESLKDFLREKKILLILDNFEQITSAAPFVAEIANAAPRLKILTTSRETLRLKNEQEFKVPALDLPSEKLQTAELLKNEAVKLFIERARKIKPNFTLSDEILQTVAAICVRLEGLPLAIEFAAARTKILSPNAILSKLENRLQLLSGGAQDLPSRQQTMRGAIDWSYDLLAEDEKVLFRRLAVFAGGFTFEAAEFIVEREKGRKGEREKDFSAPISPSPLLLFSPSVLDGVTSLLDKSLIFAKENADGEPRFQMLEVVREYAAEVLFLADETEAMRRNHAEYFLELAEKAEPHFRDVQAAEWLNLLDEDNDNLRASIEWTLETDAEKAIRLTAALSFFWLLRGYLAEGFGRLSNVLEKQVSLSPKMRFALLYPLGWINLMQADYEHAQEIFEELLILGRNEKDLEQIARAARALTSATAHLGDFDAAQKFCEEGLAASRELDDKLSIANALNSLGNLMLMQDRFSKARGFYEESLMIARQLGNNLTINSNLINLATVSFYETDYQKAQKYYAESLRLAQKSGNKVVVSYCLDGFAALAVKDENFEKAAKLAGAAEEILKSISAEIELIERKFRDAYLAELRAGFGADEFKFCCNFGRKMTFDEAIGLALEIEKSISQ